MKTKVFIILAMFLWGVVLWPLPAEAVLITIEIEAVVDSVTDDGNYLEGQISPGDTITGWYIYDTSTLDTNPSPNGGHYEHYTLPSGIFLSVGGFDFETDPANVNFLVEIENDHPPEDNYFLLSPNNTTLPNGTSVNEISWWLNDPTGSALSSDALPTIAPVLEDWQSNTLIISGPGGHGPGFGIWAHVTSAVPEPASIILLGLGGLLIRKRQ